MSDNDLRFYLRVNADEFPYVEHDAWLVSGASYRGRYLDAEGSPRRRVRLFHPDDESRSVVLHADQLEPDVHAWDEASAPGEAGRRPRESAEG